MDAQTPVADGGRPAEASRFNMSRWALEHPALTRYLMIVLLLLGVAAYFQLGQDEDPPFTFRAMVVQAFWPGATAQQMAEQVTDKIEKSLQEVPYADILRSYTKPGESLTILQLKDSSPPKEVAHSWYQARKRIGDMRSSLPQGVVGPVFNDDFGDVYGSILALSADGFSDEELRVFADDVRVDRPGGQRQLPPEHVPQPGRVEHRARADHTRRRQPAGLRRDARHDVHGICHDDEQPAQSRQALRDGAHDRRVLTHQRQPALAGVTAPSGRNHDSIGVGHVLHRRGANASRRVERGALGQIQCFAFGQAAPGIVNQELGRDARVQSGDRHARSDPPHADNSDLHSSGA